MTPETDTIIVSNNGRHFDIETDWAKFEAYNRADVEMTRKPVPRMNRRARRKAWAQERRKWK